MHPLRIHKDIHNLYKKNHKIIINYIEKMSISTEKIKEITQTAGIFFCARRTLICKYKNIGTGLVKKKNALIIHPFFLGRGRVRNRRICFRARACTLNSHQIFMRKRYALTRPRICLEKKKTFIFASRKKKTAHKIFYL